MIVLYDVIGISGPACGNPITFCTIGRPESENSWEKEATVSRERMMEYEAS